MNPTGFQGPFGIYHEREVFPINNLTLTVSDVQQAMNVGRNTAYELVNREDFPKIRVGRKIIIPRDAFLRWLDQQTNMEAN